MIKVANNKTLSVPTIHPPKLLHNMLSGTDLPTIKNIEYRTIYTILEIKQS